ncbi:hypothetical protein TNCV_2947531 [Trichonephila clavipes]|nr:hypothetical protein TNCV_2947531 [Trichonephila clavipes]
MWPPVRGIERMDSRGNSCVPSIARLEGNASVNCIQLWVSEEKEGKQPTVQESTLQLFRLRALEKNL